MTNTISTAQINKWVSEGVVSELCEDVTNAITTTTYTDGRQRTVKRVTLALPNGGIFPLFAELYHGCKILHWAFIERDVCHAIALDEYDSGENIDLIATQELIRMVVDVSSRYDNNLHMPGGMPGYDYKGV